LLAGGSIRLSRQLAGAGAQPYRSAFRVAADKHHAARVVEGDGRPFRGGGSRCAECSVPGWAVPLGTDHRVGVGWSSRSEARRSSSAATCPSATSPTPHSSRRWASRGSPLRRLLAALRTRRRRLPHGLRLPQCRTQPHRRPASSDDVTYSDAVIPVTTPTNDNPERRPRALVAWRRTRPDPRQPTHPSDLSTLMSPIRRGRTPAGEAACVT
jgi:hypothetical protein